MRKILPWIISTIAGVLLVLFSTTSVSQAREITEATGLDVNSAVITDSAGNVISHDTPLPQGTEYTVNYNWSIPNGVVTRSGDTMNFYVPNNVRIPEDDTFTMTSTNGGLAIGTAFIAAGSHVGTVTLNSVFTFRPLNRTGYIRLSVEGTNLNEGELSPIAMSKTASWVDPSDPTVINWEAEVFGTGNQLLNPVFTDTISPNQTYIPDSARLTNNLGASLPVAATADGSNLHFSSEGSYVGNLKLSYQTKTNEPTGNDTFTNQINYIDENGNNGSADASISRPPVTEPTTGSVTLTKTDAQTHEPVFDATYNLLDSSGNVIQSDLTTNEQGQLVIKNLAPGSYSLVETIPPEGYELNNEPINFTIVAGQTIDLGVANEKNPSAPVSDGNLIIKKVESAQNRPLTGAVFSILDSDGEVVRSNLVTDSAGEVHILGLQEGNYTLVETTSPEGYEPSSPIPFTIVAGETKTVTVSDVLTTQPEPMGILLVQKDASSDKAPLAGAVFEIRDANGTVVKSNLTTDEKGQIIVTDLPVGTYTLIETTAPNGYEINQAPVEFTITANEVTTVNVSDEATEPGVTEPGTTEPGTTEPGPTEPGTTEPGTTEPSVTEPSTSEPSVTKPTVTSPSGSSTVGTVTPQASNPISQLKNSQSLSMSPISGQNAHNRLPQTGAKKSSYLTVIAAILLVIAGIATLVFEKKKNAD